MAMNNAVFLNTHASAVGGPMHSLPARDVNESTITDAYVAFILYCNPAVPAGVDTEALRQAFETPPRSDGRVFAVYRLFVLITQYESRIIKSWGDVALELGVTPPDIAAGQSSQKIQQYSVRLKRWMHSMHVDAFFAYLTGRETEYWTEIPSPHVPVTDLVREGVEAKDDMALRALMPEIRPRRGRRRDDEPEHSESSESGNEVTGATGGTGGGSTGPGPARKTGQRHGAKVVSSAWRGSGPNCTGKARGRPPNGRRARNRDSGGSDQYNRPPSRESENGGYATETGGYAPVSLQTGGTPTFASASTAAYGHPAHHIDSAVTSSPLSRTGLSPHDFADGPEILPPPVGQHGQHGQHQHGQHGQHQHGQHGQHMAGVYHQYASAPMGYRDPRAEQAAHHASPHLLGMDPHGLSHNVGQHVYATGHLQMPPSMNLASDYHLYGQHPGAHGVQGVQGVQGVSPQMHMGGMHPLTMAPAPTPVPAPSMTHSLAGYHHVGTPVDHAFRADGTPEGWRSGTVRQPEGDPMMPDYMAHQQQPW